MGPWLIHNLWGGNVGLPENSGHHSMYYFSRMVNTRVANFWEKQLFRRTQYRRKFLFIPSEFGSKPFRGRKNARNYVPNHFVKDKNIRNFVFSFRTIPQRIKMLWFRSEPFRIPLHAVRTSEVIPLHMEFHERSTFFSWITKTVLSLFHGIFDGNPSTHWWIPPHSTWAWAPHPTIAHTGEYHPISPPLSHTPENENLLLHFVNIPGWGFYFVTWTGSPGFAPPFSPPSFTCSPYANRSICEKSSHILKKSSYFTVGTMLAQIMTRYLKILSF